LKVGNLLTLDRTPSYRVEASFDNIGGLKLRSPVKAAGVVVGRVESIKLDPKTYAAVVSMRIDRDYSFSKDTMPRSIPRDCSVKSTWVSMRGATPRC
jgi:phospholipid/cholesterol/gamma-HCH transport system substrate-binding protein